MKKLARYLIIMLMTTWFVWSFCRWLPSFGGNADKLNKEFPYENKEVLVGCTDSTDLGNCVSLKWENGNDANKTIIRRLLEVFGLNSDIERDLKFIDYAKAILNIALTLISFIALIITIYTFYMMFFSENEAWIKKAKWNLVGIFIALAIIWLAWIIVSFIFRWYQSNWKQNEWNIWNLVAVNYSISDINNQIYFPA